VKDSYLFISDIHLGLQSAATEKRKERLLVNFFKFAQGNAKELYIVGDLFDYWFEYKRVYQKGFFRTLTALQDLTESGTKVHYLIGNHDFMHRNFFSDEIGVIMYENSVDTVINGKKFFIDHGDGLVKNDYGYMVLKKIMRNKFLQKMYSILHPDLGVSIGSNISKTSRDYTSKKDYGEEDGMLEAAKGKIDEGYEFVLFGHSHSRSYIHYKNGCYINLGWWYDAPCYGIFKDNKFEIVDWK
jgi:UDP-2,3-diacylglucosamine hydrolase